MPLAQLHDGTLHHLHTDHLGTPLEASNDAGDITWRITYRTWGNTVVEEVQEIAQNLRFQGQYFDAETGLHYNRFRYYEPGVGRFVNQDPIGLEGGVNLFQYAPNPVGWVDPLGLAPSRKPITGKPNIDNRSQSCKCWEVKRYDRSCEGHVPGVGNAKYFHDPKDGSWYSVDQTGHGGSAFKQFSQKGSTLQHAFDLDQFGDRMGKHKGEAGKIIDLKLLKCKDAKP